MTLKLFSLVITCVALSTLSQLFMKLGVSGAEIQTQLGQGLSLRLLSTAATNLYVVAGITMYVLAAGFWMLVLSRADLSLVYPFVGLGFVLIMLLGWLVLHEPLNLSKVFGTVLIAVGVYYVARS